MSDSANIMTRAFLSHSWSDKTLARRLARRLSHRDVPVWVDENEMQIGTVLSSRLAAEIAQSSHFLVLLTKAAGKSKWVAQETEVARSQPDIIILPLIAEEGINTGLLDQSLGISIADPWTFEERLDTIASAILGRPIPGARDVELLRNDLRAIGREVPELRGLIEQLGNNGRLTHAQLEALVLEEPLRHPAETALIALHECANADARYVISLVAAVCFLRLGVGYEVLRRQIAVEPEGSGNLSTMFNYLGNSITRPEDIDGARRLFDLASPPMDQAFAQFVRLNFDKFTQSQRDWAVRFITVPDRGPGGFAGDAAFELFSRLPASKSLQALWFFWINDYKFGGKPDVEGAQRASVFFHLMNEATGKGLAQFDPVMDNFESCFRRLARASKLGELLAATGLLRTAANSRYVRRKGLADQLAAAVHSAEWDTFEYREAFADPISNLAHAIASDQDYDLGALTEALKTVRGRGSD